MDDYQKRRTTNYMKMCYHRRLLMSTNPSSAKWKKCSNCLERLAAWSKINSLLWLNNSFKDSWRLPALILIFSDSRRFPLRPIFFAYEDRKQITRLIVETYHRLSSALILDDNPATAKELWDKTTAFTTDSVSKNPESRDRRKQKP